MLNLILAAVLKAVANFAVAYLERIRTDELLKREGALTQATESRQKAEAAETKGRAAGDAATDSEDDPRDLRD